MTQKLGKVSKRLHEMKNDGLIQNTLQYAILTINTAERNSKKFQVTG